MKINNSEDIEDLVRKEFNMSNISITDTDEGLKIKINGSGDYLNITMNDEYFDIEGTRKDGSRVETECKLEYNSIVNTIANSL